MSLVVCHPITLWCDVVSLLSLCGWCLPSLPSLVGERGKGRKRAGLCWMTTQQEEEAEGEEKGKQHLQKRRKQHHSKERERKAAPPFPAFSSSSSTFWVLFLSPSSSFRKVLATGYNSFQVLPALGRSQPRRLFLWPCSGPPPLLAQPNLQPEHEKQTQENTQKFVEASEAGPPSNLKIDTKPSTDGIQVVWNKKVIRQPSWKNETSWQGVQTFKTRQVRRLKGGV